MSAKRNWPVTLGIVFGVVVGVITSKSLDRFWATPVHAEGATNVAGKKVATEQAEIFRYAAKTIGPAVVNVTTMQHVRQREGGGLQFDELGMPFYRPPKIREGEYPRGIGSGFVFDAANGYILTNNHVVAEGDAWEIRMSDKRQFRAKLVGTDPQTDVAVLKIEPDNGKLTAAALGNSDAVEVGDWVLAVGNPYGILEQTVTAGIISAKGRRGLNISNYEDFLQTDAAINAGNSGGPLVNLDGEVVGINTAIFSRTGGYQGVGFSIPINQAKRIAERLIKNGFVTRGWMGVKVGDAHSDDANAPEAAGVSVEGVYLGGPAKAAGMLPGDVLVEINGKAVRSKEDIPSAVADLDPGTIVKVVVRRKNQDLPLKLTVGTQPRDWMTRSRD